MRQNIIDLHYSGGVGAVLNELNQNNLLNGDSKCVALASIGEAVKDKVISNHKVVRSIKDPYSPEGGIAILKWKPSTQLRSGKAVGSGS